MFFFVPLIFFLFFVSHFRFFVGFTLICTIFFFFFYFPHLLYVSLCPLFFFSVHLLLPVFHLHHTLLPLRLLTFSPYTHIYLLTPLSLRRLYTHPRFLYTVSTFFPFTLSSALPLPASRLPLYVCDWIHLILDSAVTGSTRLNNMTSFSFAFFPCFALFFF